MADRQPARLFSTDGIESKSDARRRAAEALMAAMAAAPTAGRALLSALGVRADSRTTIESYVNVRLGRTAVDGLVVARKGRSEVSVAFVVRVADDRLTAASVKRVREAAAEHDVNAVVTVSSEATGPDLGGGRSSVPVGHWPWGSVLTALVDQKVRDPEQARILGDLVAFLQHPDVGAGAGVADMGPNWAKVVQTARTSRLSARNAGVIDVARRWDQVARTVGTGLGAEIDRDVQLVLPAREAKDADQRHEAVLGQLVDRGQLEAVWSVEDAAGDLAVIADLEGRRLVTVVAVEPPDGLGERATVGWLLDGSTMHPTMRWSRRGAPAGANPWPSPVWTSSTATCRCCPRRGRRPRSESCWPVRWGPLARRRAAPRASWIRWPTSSNGPGTTSWDRSVGSGPARRGRRPLAAPGRGPRPRRGPARRERRRAEPGSPPARGRGRRAARRAGRARRAARRAGRVRRAVRRRAVRPRAVAARAAAARRRPSSRRSCAESADVDLAGVIVGAGP